MTREPLYDANGALVYNEEEGQKPPAASRQSGPYGALTMPDDGANAIAGFAGNNAPVAAYVWKW